jgi:hypothetical protein
VDADSPKIEKFLDSLMPSFIEQLGLVNSKRAVLVKVTKDLEDDFQGATHNIELADCYLVLIKAPKRLTPITLMEMATTLAHEMVHVKQYVYGETNEKLTRWKGERVDSDTIDYWVQPWEIEAHGYEAGLFTKFAIKEKLWEVFNGVQNPDSDIIPEPLGWK